MRHCCQALQHGLRLLRALRIEPLRLPLQDNSEDLWDNQAPNVDSSDPQSGCRALPLCPGSEVLQRKLQVPRSPACSRRSFSEEVGVLNLFFGRLASGGAAYVIGDPSSPNRNWHVYYASEKPETPLVTIEMCMTGLHTEKATVFFKNSAGGNVSSAKEMTLRSGISHIIPEMEICDFGFEPCGYSMNGINGKALSTIHVTPEEGFSYASYEAMGLEPCRISYGDLIERVLRCFEPANFSVAVTIFGGRPFACSSFGGKLDVEGYKCRVHGEQDLPGGGLLWYQSFCGAAMDEAASPRSILCWEAEDVGKKKSGKEMEF